MCKDWNKATLKTNREKAIKVFDSYKTYEENYEDAKKYLLSLPLYESHGWRIVRGA